VLQNNGISTHIVLKKIRHLKKSVCKNHEGSIPFARSILKIANGIKPLAVFEFYEKPK
jgi:hypothetical protein